MNIVTWSAKILKDSWGAPLWSSTIFRKNEKLTLLDALKIHSQRTFSFCFIKWTKWSYYQFIDILRLWLCYKFQCSIFSKGIQFDFIKYNIIWKLAYKVKSWMHNWEGLTTCQFFLTSAIQQLCSSGFPIRVQLVGVHFGQNWQKLEENYKTNIFGAKQWGDMGG